MIGPEKDRSNESSDRQRIASSSMRHAVKSSVSWRGFQALLKVGEFSRKRSVRAATYAILYSGLALIFIFYLIEKATHRRSEGELEYCVWIIIAVSGLNTTAFLFLGFPFLFPSRLWWIALIDFSVWALLVAIDSMLIYVQSTGDGLSDVYQEWICVLGLVLAIRINTFLTFNTSLDAFVTKNEIYPKTRAMIGVPVERIEALIARSALSTNCKAILDRDLLCAELDGNGKLNCIEFFYFVHGSMRRNVVWRLPCSKNKEAYETLLSQLDFANLVPEQDEGFLQSTEQDDGIVATMIVASRLLFGSQKLLGVATSLALCVGAVAQPGFVLLAGNLVNLGVDIASVSASASNELDSMWQEFTLGIVGLIALWLVDEVTWYLSCVLGANAIENASAGVQKGLARCALYSDMAFDKKYNPGALSNVFSSSLAKTEQVWHDLLYRFVRSIASLVAAIVFLALFDVSYALMVITTFPVITSFHFLELKATSCSAKADVSSARLLGRFQNTVSVQTAAKACNSQAFVMGRFNNVLAAAKHDNYKTFLWSNIVQAIFTTVGYGLNTVTTVVFLFELADGHLTSGEFFSLTGFVLGVITPIENIGTVSGDVARMSGAVHKINTVLEDGNKGIDGATDSEKEMRPLACSLTLEKEVTLDHVHFSYGPDLPMVIEDVSISIASGSYACFLGESGSGKSSLLSLLTGARMCTAGLILMDGVDISTVPLRYLRDSLAVVFQETFVLDGTIFDNIAFGQFGQSDNLYEAHEIVANAARDAQIHDFIDGLPDKYDTVIGKEASISLSGGQLQRICGVARALARKPKLLILDEATSALDKISERLIIKSIERLRDNGLTIVSFTHHPATAKKADKIVMLDGGVVCQQGTYSELYRQAGLFSEIISAERRRSLAASLQGISGEIFPMVAMDKQSTRVVEDHEVPRDPDYERSSELFAVNMVNEGNWGEDEFVPEDQEHEV